MVNKDELLFKLKIILEYLKSSNGYNYKLYNRLCPGYNTIPDSNIVEYAEDVINMVKILLDDNQNTDLEELPF